MATEFEKCPQDVCDLANDVMRKYHPELYAHEVTVGLLFAFNTDGGDSVKLHGYSCAAVVRRTTTKQRLLGNPDAEITISRDWWDAHSDDEHEALLDHELEHLVISKGDDGHAKVDSAGRPKLAMRLHDWETGGFESIVKRHGNAAPEKQAWHTYEDRYGQLLMWDEAQELSGAK